MREKKVIIDASSRPAGNNEKGDKSGSNRLRKIAAGIALGSILFAGMGLELKHSIDTQRARAAAIALELGVGSAALSDDFGTEMLQNVNGKEVPNREAPVVLEQVGGTEKAVIQKSPIRALIGTLFKVIHPGTSKIAVEGDIDVSLQESGMGTTITKECELTTPSATTTSGLDEIEKVLEEKIETLSAANCHEVSTTNQ